jgi:hypothetical protein
MKTTFSSSILKALTAGRLRPRQMEERYCHRLWRGLGWRWADGAVRGGSSAGLRVRGTGGVPAEAALSRGSTAERGKPQRFESGCAPCGFTDSAVVHPCLPKVALSSACSAEMGGPLGAESGGAFRQRSRGWGGAQGFSGAGAKAGAGVVCGAWACCGAALPCLPYARRWAGGRGAALPRREGRRRVTFWALPRCGPSWGFA